MFRMALARTLVFVALVSPSLFARADALDQWMTRTSPVPFTATDITYAKGLFVAVGNAEKLGAPRLIVSSNGMDWLRFASFAPFSLRAIAYGSNGLFVIVGRTDVYDGAVVPGVCVSTNGTNWNSFPAFGDVLVKTNFEAVVYGSNQFVAVGDHGITALSENGTNWETHATPTPYNLTGVSYGNGVWVAVGPKAPPGGPGVRSDGPLLTSLDGITWVQQNAAFNATRVLFANGLFIAMPGDTFEPNLLPMRCSYDGTNWVSISEPAIHIMQGITCGGAGMFVSVARNVIKMSLDGTNWVRRFPTNPDVTNRLVGVAYGANTFVAAGDVLLQSSDVRPSVRIHRDLDAPPLLPDGVLYLRGISNAHYGVEISSSLQTWGQRVRVQATGGEDEVYHFSGSRFLRVKQVP